MQSKTISNYISEIKLADTTELAHLLQATVFTIIKKSQEPLIELMYERGISQTAIAKKLGVSRAAVSLQYPFQKYKGGSK